MIERIQKLERMVKWLYRKVKNTTAVLAGLIVGMLYYNTTINSITKVI